MSLPLPFWVLSETSGLSKVTFVGCSVMAASIEAGDAAVVGLLAQWTDVNRPCYRNGMVRPLELLIDM